jgi:hypothetical protein
VTIWIGICIELHHRFDSSEVFLMKNFARWALAFATVTSISGSAMAVRNDLAYVVTAKSGLRAAPLNVGIAAFQLVEQSGPFLDRCCYAARWGVATGPGAAQFGNLFVCQTTVIGRADCDMNSFWFTDGKIELDTDPGVPPSVGINTRLQKATICNFSGIEDEDSGKIKAVITFGNPFSMPVSHTFSPQSF